MSPVVVLILGFVPVFPGYRIYAKDIDSNILSEIKRATLAKIYGDGLKFMPANKNAIFGYQFKSVACAVPMIGSIIAVRRDPLPALIRNLAVKSSAFCHYTIHQWGPRIRHSSRESRRQWSDPEKTGRVQT